MNNSFTVFNNVIEAVRKGELGEYDIDGNYKSEPVCFNIYWKDDGEHGPGLSDEVFAGEPEDVDEDVPDEEYDYALLPQPVKNRGWCLAYSGETVEAVIRNALTQKPSASNQELLQAIEYYSEFDTFLEL